MDGDSKVIGLTSNGRLTREYYPEYEPMPEYYTLDMPGAMPGTGATYVGGSLSNGKFFGGRWEYDPFVPSEPYPYT